MLYIHFYPVIFSSVYESKIFVFESLCVENFFEATSEMGETVTGHNPQPRH